MTRAETTAAHGRNSRYTLGCRCPECREAHRLYGVSYKAGNRTQRGQTDPPKCIHCHLRIVGIPDGWKHQSTNRQGCTDGINQATPRTIR